MAYRGGGFRGRGRGRGYGFATAKQEEIILFPDVELPDVKCVKEEKFLASYKSRLESYWRSSAYYLDEDGPKDAQRTEIGRYSDRVKKKTTVNRGPLVQFLELSPTNFPRELLHLTKQGRGPSRKRVRWNPDSGWQKFDLYEQREKQLEARGDKAKGEDEEEKEDDEDDDGKKGSEDEADQVDYDDYNQNIDFDDDEDDLNMDDDNEDEPAYD